MKSCCDEYCANYGCNQGRNCPARATPADSQVIPWIGAAVVILTSVMAMLWAHFK